METKKIYELLYALLPKQHAYPYSTGVYHNTDVLVITDAHYLIEIKAEFQADLNGKIIDKNGATVDDRFPNYKAVIPETKGMQELTDDFIKKNLLKAAKNTPKGKDLDSERILIKVGDILLHNQKLIKVLSLFAAIKEIPRIYTSKPNRAVKFISENCMALLMPCISDLPDKIFTVEQGLNYCKPAKAEKVWYE